jgi:hypothetical protein
MTSRNLGGRVTFALAALATITLVALGAAAAPAILFGVRAGNDERLMRALIGGATLTLGVFPLLLGGGAILCGGGWRVARELWMRALLTFPAAALAGCLGVTLLLLNYTAANLFALGGATLFAALFAWGNLVLIRRTLTPPPLSPADAWGARRFAPLTERAQTPGD